MLLPQFAVDLDEAVIDLRIVADQSVGGYQAAEPVPERGAGGKTLRFVDEDAGNPSVLLEHVAQLFEHFVIGELAAAGQDDAVRHEEHVRLHDGRERPLRTHPQFRRILDVLALEFEGSAVVDVVADVFFVGQHLVHGAVRPRTRPKSVSVPRLVEQPGDLRLVFLLVDELLVDPAHGLDFLARSGHQDHAVGLDALLLSEVEHPFVLTVLIDPASGVIPYPAVPPCL